MKISKKQGNVAVLDIGKTHVKVILFNTDKLEELVVFQTSNKVLNKNPYPHFDVEALKSLLLNLCVNFLKTTELIQYLLPHMVHVLL